MFYGPLTYTYTCICLYVYRYNILIENHVSLFYVIVYLFHSDLYILNECPFILNILDSGLDALRNPKPSKLLISTFLQVTSGDTGEPARAEDLITRKSGVDPADVSDRLYNTQILMGTIDPDRDAVSIRLIISFCISLKHV